MASMREMKMKRIFAPLACVLSVASGMLWGMTADELVQKTGIAGGLCSFPRVQPSDDKLALELAKRPAFVVHVMSQDVQAAARVRDAAESAGALGRLVRGARRGCADLGVDYKAMNTNSNLELALSEYLYQRSRLY